MARKVRTIFLYGVALFFLFASLYHQYLRDAISDVQIQQPPSLIVLSASSQSVNPENLTDGDAVCIPPEAASNPIVVPSPPPPLQLSADAILFPDWEVLVIVSPDRTSAHSNRDANYSCVFDTGEVSAASFSGVIPFPDRSTFNCELPTRARRRLPFRQPLLSESRSVESLPVPSPPPLLRWSYIVYDSLTTEYDVVLFVKGVNVRQGTNRSPNEFRCVFGENEIDAATTAVTSSMQEVFRCRRPDPTAATPSQSVKISLQIVGENSVIPSVAYYNPPRRLASSNPKSLLCAVTMVYDVAKFLREWVLYHSAIGVEKFILYDNGSDDDLLKSVNELTSEGFDITIYTWRWPKTQESGFSHSSIYAKDVCSWVIYIDVDEFVYSPNWSNVSEPSKSLLHSLITTPQKSSSRLGQVSIGCHEFGPSDQISHPEKGVTQGYNCRRKLENRHKSIVLLDAVDESLVNVIHHFHLKPGHKTRIPKIHDMVVNHYKYQAWPEFKAKFRRRVSAYVLDWTKKLNPNSNDRAPGLGYSPVEPEGWPKKFCEVHDNRLRDLVRRWFGSKMGWQAKMG